MDTIADRRAARTSSRTALPPTDEVAAAAEQCRQELRRSDRLERRGWLTARPESLGRRQRPTGSAVGRSAVAAKRRSPTVSAETVTRCLAYRSRPVPERSRNGKRTIAFWLFVAPDADRAGRLHLHPDRLGLPAQSLQGAATPISLGELVGLQQLRRHPAATPAFRDSLRTIVIFTLFIVPLTFAVSLALGHAGQWRRAGAPASSAPSFSSRPRSPTSIASLVWRMGIFNGVPSGVANWRHPLRVRSASGNAARFLRLDPPSDRHDPPWYWLVLVTVRLWLQVGFYMIIFIAGLAGDSARSLRGGLGRWRPHGLDDLPLTSPCRGLRNTSIAVLLLNFIAAFQAFDEFFNILGGTAASQGNHGLARPPLVYLYRVGFKTPTTGVARPAPSS